MLSGAVVTGREPTLQAALNLHVGPSVTKSFTTHAEIENHGVWTKLAARFDRFWHARIRAMILSSFLLLCSV